MEKSVGPDTVRVMSWNIGSFIFLKYFAGATNDRYEYFQPNLNGNIVSDTIKNINPHFIYLQEFWFPEDADAITILAEYPHRAFFDTWYRKKGIFIAGKKPFSQKVTQGFPVIHFADFTIIPIHLHSFSPSRRNEQIQALCQILSTVLRPVILLGDTNLWSRKNRFLFPKDKQGYLKLTELLVDASKDVLSTSFFGFGLDKIFTSQDVAIKIVASPKVRGAFMDHYPIYLDAN